MKSPAKQVTQKLMEAPKGLSRDLPALMGGTRGVVDQDVRGKNAKMVKWKHEVLNKRQEVKETPRTPMPEKFNPPRMVLTPLNQIGTVDPLTGLPVQKMTNVPPAPSNTLGQAQPVFNQQAQQNAQGMFGNQQALQNSVGASALFQRQLGNRGAYKPSKPGDLIDESVNDESNYNSTNAGKISGMKYNIENLSEIQKDKDGQFVVSLDENEFTTSGPSGRVSNYDQGEGAVRDTLRPAVGKKFYNFK
tara:strand:- start:1112 stop:1852 length:741 start_codon:yes stop_codon:yes gene_type:complete